MTTADLGPVPWAGRLSRMLDGVHAIHGGSRYPVDVENLIPEIPGAYNTGEPIVVQGQELDPEF